MPSRTSSRLALRGSQRWLQLLINERPELVDAQLLPLLGAPPRTAIDWRSPLRAHGFREYRDEESLRRLDAPALRTALGRFWPRRGPVWDALGRSDRNDLIFVEAKAHIAEMASPPSKASPASLRAIRRSLSRVQRELAPKSEADWSRVFYQYTNRLAHLWFFRVENRLPAHLLFVYFLHADDVGGPSDVPEWKAALTLLKSALGLGRHRLHPYVHDIFIDVRQVGDPCADSGVSRAGSGMG